MLIFLLASNIAGAAPRIAILEFELNDITSLPNTPKERIRTASFRPLLEQALLQLGDYEIISISHTEQATANSSFGYLFRFDDLAADLSKRHGADWVIVSQHSKPSFLFSYLMAHLIRVKDRTLAADYAIELKGNHEKVSLHGTKALANKIHDFIDKQKTESP
ncbi:DUF2380 domain-containing protein [Methylomarinum sp. Ch1-1]|uniref:DUF2380 domain-containing protein n=1 Tax=Methylomarinum roseum TaxID=3067653 RepID=A0AAU7NZN2_9GAMM|nr:DUF2380 domain-containing protein [Methylomarinum sp. Ch1-1]MDP4521447.1 DUF2380 domain-containing protein [Methylomarinum sp. Ch1-1]